MASQIVSTAGLAGRKLRRRQTTELEAKMPFLKQIQAQKLQKQMHEDTIALQKKQLSQDASQAKKSHKLKKKGLALEQLTAEREMGVSAAKFGANLVMNSGSTIADTGAKLKSGLSSLGIGKTELKGPHGGTTGTGGTVTPAPSTSSTGFFGSLQPGKLLGGGLAGFGASRFVKGKGKRFMLGAAAGGLMSLFGGGATLGGAAGGALFGGLGGLL